MQHDKIKPILFSIIKHTSKEELKKQLPKDIVSGIVVAVVALPLSIALAIASGVGPEAGLYTAIIAGFLIAFLGGSRVQISGPTAAFATIVAGIVATDGLDGLFAATIIAGIVLILMGLLKLGALIRFVPYTITTGFTVQGAIEAIRYYGGEAVGIAAIFASVNECAGYPVASIFNTHDLPDYETHDSHSCPWCKQGKKIDALVNSFGYSAL